MVTRATLVGVVALCACQGHGDQAPPPAPKDARVVKVEPPAVDALAPDEPVREPEPPDPGKLIADLGAVSAWQAVIDRAHYLARRGQHGIVYGTVGSPLLVADPATDGGLVPTGDTWLVDDTEGNGALAIRVRFVDAATAPKQGDRVALSGAWVLDDNKRWFWKVERVTPLPPAPPSDLKDPPAQPGHQIVDGSLPAGARTISVAHDNDVVFFQLTGPKQPVLPGEGWPVADELGDQVFALLNLPGEWPSFGGQDFRTANERWELKRGQLYYVRIGKIRRPAPDKPALINARTAPVRVK